ncbi:hypothetical protein IPH19_05125 [Candidatus Uhrbacteria bacterium]|nr:MAG: hypothetical protein IPH19_05125 [Candidatus Uhrbacteria bacterium]
MPDEHIIGSGMTEQELQLASWWVRNRERMRSIIRWTLIILNIIFWAFVLWSLLDAYIISYPREARIPRIIAENQLAISGLQATTPQALLPSDVTVFEISGNRKDFLVQLSNSNETWWASFDYRFRIGDLMTDARKGFILPKSQRYLTELGSSIDTTSRNAQLVIENIEWHRVDPNAVNKDYAAFAANRLQFDFSDITYRRDLTIGAQIVGQTSSTFSNPSPYGYWNVDLTVILYRGTTPAGVTTIGKQQVGAGSSQPLIVNWFDNLSGITRTEISAYVNILDPEAYFP